MSFAINVRGSLGCNYRKKLLRTKEENKLNLNENMKKSSYKMMTKTLYVQVVCIIAIFEFFTQCLCSTSANSQNDDKTRISSIIPSKMLLDDFESVTTAKNLISEPNDLVIDDQIVKIGFQYFNDPLKISTPKYETIPEITYDNHQPIHQLDLNYSHLPQISNDDYAVQPQIIPSHHIVQVTREPIWAPEVIKLENQYISTFRSIRSSVMNFYYKMQNFVSYVMSFFSVDKLPLMESRGKKGKFKIKKKYKKFILPLLIAYKLKFFALIPFMIGGLILLIGSTGMAGFFFALFTAVISLKGGHH